MSDPEPSDTDTKSPDPRLLEDLDEHIRDARTAAEDAVGYEGGPSFVDSGDVSRDDDGGQDSTDSDDGVEDSTDSDDDIEDRTDTDSTDDDQTIAPPG
ncbi:MAG: hypothetical protein QOJ69_969 [Actinomycetota bacterium]|jgi:hypothetical protein|nr:hypothetical protein [Actinomycetota bacterium]MEA2843298.1 hypothetical protein [Actinomycetota bacterium]